jgi:hypothetical protein
MARKKTWREKLSDSKDLPKVVLLKEDARRLGADIGCPLTCGIFSWVAAHAAAEEAAEGKKRQLPTGGH